MKLNEKILYYRKAARLSQEELAARVGVSRQAVSKWELGDATPEVDKLLALARAFGVATDELLGEGEPAQTGEAAPPPQGGPDTAPPAAPGEAHLTQEGWTHAATALSLAACAVGTLVAVGGWLFSGRASYEWVSGMLIAGLAVQVLGVLLFELAAPRMGAGRGLARLNFYMAACWLMPPALLAALFWYGFWYGPLVWMSVPELLICSLLVSGAAAAALAAARRKMKRETP